MHQAWVIGCKFKGCEKQCQCNDGTTDEPLFGDTLEYLGYQVEDVGYCYYDIVYTKNPSGKDIKKEDYLTFNENQYGFVVDDFAVIVPLRRLPELDF